VLIEEVCDRLAREGYRDIEIGVHVAIFTGQVSKPPFNEHKQLVFGPEHLDALRLVLPKRWPRGKSNGGNR